MNLKSIATILVLAVASVCAQAQQSTPAKRSPKTFVILRCTNSAWRSDLHEGAAWRIYDTDRRPRGPGTNYRRSSNSSFR